MAGQDYSKADQELTLTNRRKLSKNKNLLLWYQELYRRQFAAAEPIKAKNILEIGSGTSPLQLFYGHVQTSDVLNLGYLDYIFDCHHIDRFAPIPDGSLDIITMTNVLHHLQAPVVFLVKAARKLKTGGKVILTEPYLSVFSKFIYKYLHHEPVVLDIEKPELAVRKGPLTSANTALPHLIFFSNRGWARDLAPYYHYSLESVRHYTGIAYLATGGISRNFHLPAWIYRRLLSLDIRLAARIPRLISSFFILEMTKKL